MENSKYSIIFLRKRPFWMWLDFIDKIFQGVDVSDMFLVWKLFNQSADLLHPMRERPAWSGLSKPAAGSPSICT